MESEWIKVKDRLPERDGTKSYSQVPCLVNKRYDYTDKNGGKRSYFQIQILAFNHEHECWDQENMDDFDCDIQQVSHWMPLPKPPTE